MRYEVALGGFQKFKDFLKGLKTANKETSKLKQNLNLIEQELATRHPMEGAFSSVDIKKQVEFKKGLKGIKEELASLTGTDRIMDMASNFKSFFATGKKGFGSLKVAIRGAWKALGPIALILGAIALTIKIVKQAFKWNIGGITAKWRKGVGEFREALGKLRLATYGLFKAMAPVFKVIGNVLMFVLKVVTKLINAMTTLAQLFSGQKANMQGMGSMGSSTTNSTNNNVTVITNQPISSSGAKGFQESLNNQVFYGN